MGTKVAVSFANIFMAAAETEIINKPGVGDTPYDGLYGEAPPERGTFFRLQVYQRVRISQVEVYIKG